MSDTISNVCCVCGHELAYHIPENSSDKVLGPVVESWWRCHCSAPDFYQCECRLLKWKQNPPMKITEYDVAERRKRLLAEEGLPEDFLDF